MTKVMVKRKFKLILPLLVFMVVYMAWFILLEMREDGVFYEIYCKADSMIPFCKYFIVPYYLWFFFVPFVVLSLLIHDEKEYLRVSSTLMFGMMLFLLISSVYPNVLYLRPKTVEGSDIFSKMVRMLYGGDTPTNVFPSVHAYNTFCVQLGIYLSSWSFFKKKSVRISSTCLSILITMATVFLKQHSVLDVTCALALMLLNYMTVYKCDFLKINEYDNYRAGEGSEVMTEE